MNQAKRTLTLEQRRLLLSTPAGWLACGFGSGLAPVAQGSFGTLAAVLPWLLLRELPVLLYLFTVLVAFTVGVRVCQRAGLALGIDDHRSLVWDEFVGLWVALIPLLYAPSWIGLVLGFALFRLFDVWKPWPIGWLDARCKGGLGVMIDDVAAGIAAALVLWLALALWPALLS